MNARLASRNGRLGRLLNERAARTVTFVSELDRGRSGTRRGDHGATAVEYGLMVGLIAVVIIVAVALFGQNMINLFAVPSSVFSP